MNRDNALFSRPPKPVESELAIDGGIPFSDVNVVHDRV